VYDTKVSTYVSSDSTQYVATYEIVSTTETYGEVESTATSYVTVSETVSE
jgi:hypothetical protein